jgi:hypothetical protein
VYQFLTRPVRAAIYANPYGIPEFPGGGYRFKDNGSGIVAGNDYHMGSGRLRERIQIKQLVANAPAPESIDSELTQ